MNLKNNFLNNIKKMNINNIKYENKAYDSIIDNLFLKNLWGKEKAMGLDEYNSEQNTKLTLIPGHIYSFRYLFTSTTKYDDGLIKFEFADNLPIVLCTQYTNNTISGINLNLCNYALRTLILNEVYNLDPNFFEQNASEQAHRGLLPISRNIYNFFKLKDNQTIFLNMLIKKFKL